MINNTNTNTKESKIAEQFSAICGSKCAILVLEPEYYNLINHETVSIIYDVISSLLLLLSSLLIITIIITYHYHNII